MKQFSNAQLANILEMTHITSEMVNKHEQKQTQPQCHKPIKKLKRPRIKVTTKELVPITSSDNHRAFIMNEWRINHPDKYIEEKKPYYRIFGQEKFIEESEIALFKAHGVTIYYK